MIALDVLTAKRDPTSFDVHEWEQCLVQARNARLLGTLGFRFHEQGVLQKFPEDIQAQIRAEGAIVVENQRALRWEVNRVLHALKKTDEDVILLKGAAYIFAGLPPATGRTASDVDILVPKAHIGDVERALIEHGWESMKLDAYDQRYYRTWMHEIPPLCHRDRDVVVDVHHTILPETGRLHPDANELIESAVAIEGERLKVLAAEDMVLHSAAHLFQDGELNGGLRDLVDLDRLLRHFGADAAFGAALIERARTMDLERPLFYALRYCERWLETPVPDSSSLETPSAATVSVMDALTSRALMPDGWEPQPLAKQWARWLLYIRSHWLRMPPILLVRHLAIKAWMRARPEASPAAAEQTP